MYFMYIGIHGRLKRRTRDRRTVSHTACQDVSFEEISISRLCIFSYTWKRIGITFHLVGDPSEDEASGVNRYFGDAVKCWIYYYLFHTGIK